MLAYVTVEGQTVLSGFRMTVIAGVFFCSILFVLSAVCKTHGRACRGTGE